MFPDTDTPTDSKTAKRSARRVQFEVTVAPPRAGVQVSLEVLDPDDPSSEDAPIDDETKATDNRGGVSGVAATRTTGNQGTFKSPMTVSRNAGDNYRVVARPPGTPGVTIVAKQMDEEGRLFNDELDPNGQHDTGEDILDEDHPLSINGVAGVVWTTELLTVWRRLRVDADSMAGGDGPGNEDPPMPDVDDPSISGLSDVFIPAFILPQEWTPESTGNETFQANFANPPAAVQYASSRRGSEGTDQFWVVHLIGVYEVYNNNRDNDPNTETAYIGYRFPDNAKGDGDFGMIPMEVIRDIGGEHGWTNAQVAQVKNVAAAALAGDQFELPFEDAPDPGHVMVQSEASAFEGFYPNFTMAFRPQDIVSLRSKGEGFKP